MGQRYVTKDARIFMKLYEGEKEHLIESAEKLGVSASEYVRTLIMTKALTPADFGRTAGIKAMSCDSDTR